MADPASITMRLFSGSSSFENDPTGDSNDPNYIFNFDFSSAYDNGVLVNPGQVESISGTVDVGIAAPNPFFF